MEHLITLRPHHGMCIAFFRGEGYSAEFVEHMQKTVRELENATVRLLCETDAICQKCPHNQAALCTAEEKCGTYDRRVLALCGIPDGSVMPFRDFAKAIQRAILSPGLREQICGDCEWNALCK